MDNANEATASSARSQAERKASQTRRFTRVRRVVQIAALAVFAAAPLYAGWGLFGRVTGGEERFTATPSDAFLFGSFSSSSLFGVTLADPFAALEVMVAAKAFSLDLLIGVLPVLVVYGLVRGRAFCGWVCPANTVLELVDWLRRKLRLNVEERVVPRHAKVYVAVGVLVLSAVLGFPLFESLSPVGFIPKLIAFGATAGGVTLVAIILAELFWGHRVWCRALCPLGGLYEVVGKIGLVNVSIDHDKCIGCNACKHACLCDPEILDGAIAGTENRVSAGDCMICGKCIEACPTGALAMKVGRP